MERIIILVDSKGVDTTSLDFACYLSQLTGSKLTGMFLHAGQSKKQSEILLQEPAALAVSELHKKAESEHPSLTIEENKKIFKLFCKNHGLSREPEISDVTLPEQIVTETRFADIFVVSAEVSFELDPQTVPSELASYILKNAECPVIIAPLSFKGIEEIVLTYDGSPSSVYAIKQFTHLLPQFEDKKITFLEVNSPGVDEIQYKDKITDYLKMHYSSIGYQVLQGNAADELFGYFISKKNVLVVIGAFGRSIVSSFFKRSTAELLLKATSLPIFITHK